MIDLSGAWDVEIDGQTGAVSLPGSLDENGIGDPNDDAGYLGGLSRKVRHVGPAIYRKIVEIPPDLVREEAQLYLERVHWTSEIRANGRVVGGSDSLSTCHCCSFPIKPGKLVLELAIDNTPRIPIGRISHALTDWTQTNWNGVIGTMRLDPLPAIRVRGIKVDVADDLAVAVITVESDRERSETLRVEATGPTAIASVAIPVRVPKGVSRHTVRLRSEGPYARWSDAEPNLYRIVATVAEAGIRRTFGVRTVRAEGKHFSLNGNPVFLRGTLECCVFPKTGYPPMDKPSWDQIMRRTKEYGLNHLRFHSWCPPEAAFAAADEAGVILQVELPLWTGHWSLSSEPVLLDFCRREAFRILNAYGHHPSFALFTLGNEMAFYGEEPKVDKLLQELRRHFPSQLHNFSSHGTHLSPECDYYVQADNGKQGDENRPLRGSTWFGVGSRFDRESPGTLTTCDEAASQFDRPVISHEVGEWAVFPDVHNEARYDGVLEARNFRAIREMLRARGMEDLSEAFVQASGKLSAILYKEEIETLLRTQGLAGYQLLGLTDFPGQGTATIGMLDAFWEPKGFVSAERFREFCAPTVPLIRIERFVWSDLETPTLEAMVFHAGSPVAEWQMTWSLRNEAGTVVRKGRFDRRDLAPGKTASFGTLNLDLGGLPSPARYEFVLEGSGDVRNRWSLWKFPANPDLAELPDVLVTPFYREDVRDALMSGRTVWLRHGRHAAGLPGRFAPAFWSPIHFKEQVGTMGTLIDADHPALGSFPTSFHTDWQWWEVLTRSKAMVLNELPLGFRPILQPIDRYERNDRLGTLFEAQVGKGRLFVSSVDFAHGGLAMTQLEASIRAHLARPYAPSQILKLTDLDRLYRDDP